MDFRAGGRGETKRILGAGRASAGARSSCRGERADGGILGTAGRLASLVRRPVRRRGLDSVRAGAPAARRLPARLYRPGRQGAARSLALHRRAGELARRCRPHRATSNAVGQ